MPFDGNGTYNLPTPSYPAISGAVISSAYRNTIDVDLQNALSNVLCRDGQSTPTANLPMGNFKLTGLAAGSADGQSLRYEQLYGAGGAATVAAARTNLAVASTSELQAQTFTAFTTAGAQPTYTVVTAPIQGIATNMRLRLKFHASNAGAAATLYKDGGGAVSIKQYDSTGVKVDPTIIANMLADVEYDGTNWVIVDPLPASIPSALNASGSAPIYAPRAWVNFNGTGVVAIRASGNVSSITDNGVGSYTVNFTTAMPDANYGFCISSSLVGGDFGTYHGGTSVQTTSALSVATGTTAGAAGDASTVCVTILR